MNCLPKKMFNCGGNQDPWSHTIHEEGDEKVFIHSLSLPGFGPAAEALLFRQKDPKPLMPRLSP